MITKMAGRLTTQVRELIAARYVEFSGCCAEMVAHGEGKKCHIPSGDNQEFSCTMAPRHILH
jgi:hypothetical protein